MQNEWIGTTEAGAGSYPEPPDVPEYTGPVCEVCGDYGEGAKLRENEHGNVLCQWCRQDYALKSATLDDILDFFKTYVSESMRDYFCKYVLIPQVLDCDSIFSLLEKGFLLWGAEARHNFLREYIDQNNYKADFLYYMEEKR